MSQLKHHGVKGMKWGVRNDKKRKKLSEMSDRELQQVVNRLRLEKEFRNLTKEVRPPTKAFVEDLVSTSASRTRKVIINTASNAVAKAVSDAINPTKRK